MGWRFRKSFSPLPGVRLTLSPSGISTSVGVGPLRLTAGNKGPAFTATIPGTGVSYRQSLGESGSSGQRSMANMPSLPYETPPDAKPMTDLMEIKSVGSNCLTTPGLVQFKRLLLQAHKEHAEISRDLAHWRSQEIAAVFKYKKWKNGWLLRRLFKTTYSKICAEAEDSTARRAELEEQELLARLETQIELPVGVKQSFASLCDQFAIMAKSERIWDTVGQRSTNRVAERTMAARAVERKPVKFQLDKCEIIESEWTVPHLENANGGDIYFYPLFVLYFVSSDAFALLEYKDINLVESPTRFIEEEHVPKDSNIVGSTWAKSNKDGSPDKRFNNNYQIPVVQYGKFSINSGTGMNEEYMVSNAGRTTAFVNALQSHITSIRSGV